MNEIPVVFGTDRHLVGTLTLPSSTTQPPDVGFLLINSGVIHRIGPHRFNVKLARELAQTNKVSLRFDLSGQGDSQVTTQAESFEEQAVADLRSAMDHLERVCGIRQFVIGGICSGAHHGLATALVDPRVRGLWMMDGYTYPSEKTNAVRYRLQLKAHLWGTLASWAISALRRLKLWPQTQSNKAAPVDFGNKSPSKESFAGMLQTLVDRGVDIYLLHSGSMLWYFNHAQQFQDAFAQYPFVKAVRCDYLPHIDHTLTSRAAQVEVISLLSEWAPSTI